MFKMRHIFGFSRNARIHFQNAREGVPDAPFSRNCARSGSTGGKMSTKAPTTPILGKGRCSSYSTTTPKKLRARASFPTY